MDVVTAVPKPLVVKDPAHLRFVRGLACHFSGWGNCHYEMTIGNGPCEASHFDTKSRDDRVLPLCGGHHRTNAVSWHSGQETFCEVYGVTKDALIQQAEALYRETHAAQD